MAPFNGVPNHQQQVALAIVPKCAAALSLLGSGYITYDVLRNKRNEICGRLRTTRATYHRLMVGMSITDLMMSAGIFMSTWPMPSEVPNVWGNVGTIGTCSAQGFFEQFGGELVDLMMFYSCAFILCVNYLCAELGFIISSLYFSLQKKYPPSCTPLA